MRRWIGVLLLFAASVSTSGPVRSAPATEVTVLRQAVMERSEESKIVVSQIAELHSTGLSVAPSVRFEARGNFNCGAGCDQVLYGTQVIQPTAFSVDPLGNSVQIDVCLLPSTGGACHPLSIKMIKPQSIAAIACYPTLACVNVWADPEFSSAETTGFVGLARDGYEVSGTWAGLDISSFGRFDGRTVQRLDFAAYVAP